MDNILYCGDVSENLLFNVFDPSLAPSLLYYSYIPIVGLSLLVGGLVYIKRTSPGIENKILFFISIFFSLYILNDILQWITAPAVLVHFEWQLITVFFTIFALGLVYFVYAFIHKKDLPNIAKLTLLLVALPVPLFLSTNLNMQAFDIINCEATIGPLFVIYSYILSLFSGVTIMYICLKHYFQTRQKQSLLLMFGSIAFLAFLNISDLISELLGNYEINLIGPVGMLLFIVMLSYLIVKYNAFNIKLIAAQALVVGLVFLVASQFFFIESLASHILVGLSVFLSISGGYFLVRSVKKEIEQKEEIAKLAETLAQANEKLKILDRMKSEFVSIASHQLRSPLTSIRGYASMLAEGSYGKLTAGAQEVAERIAESSKYMALSVEDYLNVSRIEAGNMKYEMSDFNLKDIAEKIVDELRPVAIKKGLVMVFRSQCEGSATVHADIGKTRQIIMNLLDNSMKYTPKGSITVVAHDDPVKKMMYVTIQDTGVGMSKETTGEVFEKFVRAKNANNVNVTGTGLGLYVAKKMITDMKGKVTAESEGEGKGSTFVIELPLVPGAVSQK